MANVKLLRQRVTDYQTQYARNQRNYEAGYGQYATDTEAFNKEVQRRYDYSASKNTKGDLDLVGATYYDRDAGVNRSAGDTANPLAMKTYGFAAPEGASHNAMATFTPGTLQTITDGYREDGSPITREVATNYNVNYGGGVIGTVDANDPSVSTSGGFFTRSNSMYTDPATEGLYWDAYDKTWRNAISGGVAPTQRATRDPNLTQKEIGILTGKVNPDSYATMAKLDTSASSAFADPEDPYNLKDAGILTRVIAGKL